MSLGYDEVIKDNRNDGESILRQSQLVMLRILKIVDYICDKNDISYWMDGGTLLGAVRHKGFIPWDDDIDIIMPREDYEKFIKIASHELPKDLFLQTRETDRFYDMPWAKIRDRNSKIVEYKPGKYHQGMFIDIFPVDSFSGDYQGFLKEKKKYKFKYKLITFIREPLDTWSGKKAILKNIIKTIMKLVCFPISLKSREEAFRGLDNVKKEVGSRFFREEGSEWVYGLDVMFWESRIPKNIVLPLKKITFEDSVFNAPSDYEQYLTNLFGDFMELPPEEERIPHNLGLKPILTEQEKMELNKDF